MSKIYTREGDTGLTKLQDGEKIAKNSPIFEALGRLDALNCALGLVRTSQLESHHLELLLGVQGNIFELGALVSAPKPKNNLTQVRTDAYWQRHIDNLETEIDILTNLNTPLSSFVLPGGTVLASNLHVARAACRLAELAFWDWFEKAAPNLPRVTGSFLNRLSDYLFTLARYYNNRGKDDIKWGGL